MSKAQGWRVNLYLERPEVLRSKRDVLFQAGSAVICLVDSQVMRKASGQPPNE